MAKLNEKDEEKKVVTNTPFGVNTETWKKTETPYEKSEELSNREKNTQNTYKNLESLTSKDSIISNKTKRGLNTQFVVPDEVTEADAWLRTQLEKIQSGKTSYSDQVRSMMDEILNREKFSYDVDKDTLFQQALAGAMKSGKQAMTDTVGQASALTGGYGSTYATSVGNQAYNSFIEDAYDNLPEYYQMALEAYQLEGDEMFRKFGLVSELDDKEYNRNITAYDATYQHRNRVYDEAYHMFRDEKSDAFSMANLELNEHGQRVSDAHNLYIAASNQEDKLYEREYKSWLDSIDIAFKVAGMENSDAWANKNFDEGVRQYEKNHAEQVRQYNESLAEQKRQHNDQMSYNWASLNQRGSGGSGVNGKEGSKSPSTQQVKGAKAAFENLGFAGYLDFIEKLPSDVNIGELDSLVGAESNLGMYYNTYTKSKDAFWHIPGGIDKNDTVTDQDGKPIKVKDLPKDLQEMISQASTGTEFEWDEKEKKWKALSTNGGGAR